VTTRSTFDIPAIGTPSASIVSTLQPSASSVRRRRDEVRRGKGTPDGGRALVDEHGMLDELGG